MFFILTVSDGPNMQIIATNKQKHFNNLNLHLQLNT